MKNLSSVVLVAVAALILSGCSEQKARTSDWYRENPEEIKKVQEKCRAEADAGYKLEGVLKENCKAARHASSRLTRDSVR